MFETYLAVRRLYIAIYYICTIIMCINEKSERLFYVQCCSLNILCKINTTQGRYWHWLNVTL